MQASAKTALRPCQAIPKPIAKGYVKMIEFAGVTAAFDAISEEEWMEYCKKYLPEPHK